MAHANYWTALMAHLYDCGRRGHTCARWCRACGHCSITPLHIGVETSGVYLTKAYTAHAGLASSAGLVGTCAAKPVPLAPANRQQRRQSN